MGFDPTFLSFEVQVPQASAEIADDLVLLEGSHVIDYTHFSLAMSCGRKIARWVAWNIDGATLRRELGRDGLSFKEDPRLRGMQLLGDFYVNNRLDRGHVARRADLLWGPRPEAERANADSFYYTNITPQMDNFNQSRMKGVWGSLENALLSQKGLGSRRAAVMGGPVLSEADRPYRDGGLVPREFWKLLVYLLDNVPRARAFLVSQNLVGLEGVDPDLTEFETYAITIQELEARTGLAFDAAIHEADQQSVADLRALESRPPLVSVSAIAW